MANGGTQGPESEARRPFREGISAIRPGAMPLPLAWVVALLAVPWLLMGIARLAAGTVLDRPLFALLMIGPVALAPIAARIKGRRWWLWLAMAGVAVWVGLAVLVGPLVQPVSVLTALLLARGTERAVVGRTPRSDGEPPAQMADAAEGQGPERDAKPSPDGPVRHRRAPREKPFRPRRPGRR